MTTQTIFANGAAIHLHQGDLPEDVRFNSPFVAVDTETMGLDYRRNRLCLVQLSGGDQVAHLVQFTPEHLGGTGFSACPRLKNLLASKEIIKLMHFARFDVAVLQQYLQTEVTPVYCTKVASKLTRLFTDRHGLKDLCRDLLGVDLSKQQQTTDWGQAELTPAQLAYAASDVLYLHALWGKLEQLLKREQKLDLAKECFGFLPTRAKLDLAGYDEPDLFAH